MFTPPNASINVGPGGMSQGGGGPSLHSQTNMNDSMGTGLPSTSLTLNQMNNVSVMHQQSPGSHYSSTSAGGPQFQGQQTVGMMGQGNQGSTMMSQRPMGSYRALQQGSALQFTGQEEFYGEQYGHTQSSNEPVSQQFYSDGHGEYSYQQSSYVEQNYERTFDESSQHYYEGNSQYSQQQTQYQQGSGQYQTLSQQQYPSQAAYSVQPQGYGPGQGSSSQYPQYQQGQSQQFPSYRSIQPGPAAQSQRSYSFEQGQYGNYQQ